MFGRREKGTPLAVTMVFYDLDWLFAIVYDLSTFGIGQLHVRSSTYTIGGRLLHSTTFSTATKSNRPRAVD